jgi:hypothetical protein
MQMWSGACKSGQEARRIWSATFYPWHAGPNGFEDRAMDTEPTYSLFMATDVACRILGVDPKVMLETAGLGALPYGRTEIRGSAQQYFDCWNTMEVLSPRPDYVPHLGVAISRGPVIPVFFTLSCAPDMETGMMRLAQFKSLLGPTLMRVFWDGGLLRLGIRQRRCRVPMPPSLARCNLSSRWRIFAGRRPIWYARLPRASTDRRRSGA